VGLIPQTTNRVLTRGVVNVAYLVVKLTDRANG